MFDRTEIIVGLEIGTAKVCAVVGELSEDEGLHVIGWAIAHRRGGSQRGDHQCGSGRGRRARRPE